MRTFDLVEKRTKKHSPFRFDYRLRVPSSEPAFLWWSYHIFSFLLVTYATRDAETVLHQVLRLGRSLGSE